jgi:large subunit ribosomal protein L9
LAKKALRRLRLKFEKLSEILLTQHNGETVMEVILLERVAKLGQMGDVVRVKDGFARNFLLPKGKALRATEENKAKFDSMKVHLQERNLELKGDAQTIASQLNGRSFIILRQASDTGHLFGSVSTRDLAAILTEGGFNVNRNQVALNAPIKTIGLHKVPVALHPEIEVTITINVARSADEAERIARGEDVTARRGDEEEAAEAVVAAAEAFFEKPEDAEKDLAGGEAADAKPTAGKN